MSAFGTGSNSNGQFWYGASTNFPGFLYKKNVGVGGRRTTKFAAGGNITCNTYQYLYNKYSPGQGGVGASSIANRRAKNRLATICKENKCFPCFMTLGQYSNYTHNPNGFTPCPVNDFLIPPTPVIVKYVPQPPLNVNAVSNNPDEATISFTPPVNDGGSPILFYKITITSTPALGLYPVTGASSPITIPNLPPNIPYTFNVTAVNAVGESRPSESSPSVTPAPLGSTILPITTLGSSTWTPPLSTIIYIQYLVVGGGGGGGGAYDNSSGGGGGGGLVLTGTKRVAYGQTYNVQVGAGGAGAVRPPYVSNPVTGQNDGSPGNQSTFDNIVAGGGGFGYKSRTPTGQTATGGSSASGTTPSTGGGGGTAGLGAGGGGGNSGNGASALTTVGGNGGPGTASSITGTSKTYSAGGKGGTRQTGTGPAGAANTGNGGGGGGSMPANNIGGGNGGSGIVVIQYYY